MPRRRRRRRRSSLGGFAQQIAAETQLRYGPEQDALASLLGEARRTARQRRSAVEAGTRGLQQAIGQQETLAGRAAAAHASANAALAARARGVVGGLSNAADPYKSIIESEVLGSSTRQAEGASRYAGDLAAQRAGAARYQASQLEQTNRDLAENTRAIGEKLTSLGKEQGTYASARLGELLQGRRERSAELRKIRLQQRGELNKALKLADVGQENAIALESLKAANERANTRLQGRIDAKKPGEKKVPRKGLGSLTQDQENKLVSRIQNAHTTARKLWNGGKGSTIPKKDGGSYKIKKGDWQHIRRLLAEKYDDDTANSAVDLLIRGHLSRANVNRLHSRGLHIPSRWRPRKRSKPRRR
jgi:hypothetical protein